MEEEKKMKIGISECLLGHNVRYDGSHKYDPFIVETLGQYFDFVPVCPEVECGLSTPREAMRLVGDAEKPRLITIKTQKDYSDLMANWCSIRVKELENEDLVAFIFKSKSPSSGLYNVKVYNSKGYPSKVGTGYFAKAFTERFPLLPVEEEGRLNDPKLREGFIESIFVLKRWRETLGKRPSMGKLVLFHTQHKLLFMAHSPVHYRSMGRLIGQGGKLPIKKLCDQYFISMMECVRVKTSTKKNIDVLYHIMGHFKKELDAREKKETMNVLENYRQELIPLIVPITLLNFLAKKYEKDYLLEQYYLSPHPLELKLRNHV